MHKIIFQDLKKILVSTFFVNLVNIVKNFAVASLLGPYYTGLCMSLLVIPQLAGYLDLGVADSLIVNIPKNKGRDRDYRAKKIKNEVFTFSFIISFLYFFGVLIWKLIWPSETSMVGLHVFYATLLIPFMFLTRYFCIVLAAERKFTKLAIIEFSYGFLLLATSILFILFFYSYGFWIALILSNLFVIVYAGREYIRNQSLRFVKIKLQDITRFVPLGITMLLSKAVYLPFVIAAKVYIALIIGVEYVGYFILGIIVLSLVAIIPRSIARVTLPHINHLNAIKVDSDNFFRIFWKTQFYSFILTFIVIVAGYFVLPIFVKSFLPKYIKGIGVAKIILFAALIYSLIDNANNVLITLHQKQSCLIIFISAILLQFLAFVFLFLFNLKLTGIAISFIVVFAFYAIIINYKIIKLKKAFLY